MYTKKDWKCCKQSNGETTEIKMNKGVQYAKSVCKHCNHFLKWLPNPKITKECELRNHHIDNMIQQYSSEMSEKRLNFLKSIKSKRFLAPSQYTYLQVLFELYKVKNN